MCQGMQLKNGCILTIYNTLKHSQQKGTIAMSENIHNDPDLELDFLDIATSVARQSSLYGYYGELAVDARADRDSAMNLLDSGLRKSNLKSANMRQN